jgi:hypothetical protein
MQRVQLEVRYWSGKYSWEQTCSLTRNLGPESFAQAGMEHNERENSIHRGLDHKIVQALEVCKPGPGQIDLFVIIFSSTLTAESE